MRGNIIHCGAHRGEAGCGTCRRCRAIAELAASSQVRPFPAQPAHLMPAFTMNPKPSPRLDARGRNVDLVLEHLGIRPR
jgi:hypothetical protein